MTKVNILPLFEIYQNPTINMYDIIYRHNNYIEVKQHRLFKDQFSIRIGNDFLIFTDRKGTIVYSESDKRSDWRSNIPLDISTVFRYENEILVDIDSYSITDFVKRLIELEIYV